MGGRKDAASFSAETKGASEAVHSAFSENVYVVYWARSSLASRFGLSVVPKIMSSQCILMFFRSERHVPSVRVDLAM